VFGIVALGGVEPAWADVVYSFTTIDVPGAGGAGPQAHEINDSGQIVGQNPATTQGFLYTGGRQSR
jgi:hypothetical protein